MVDLSALSVRAALVFASTICAIRDMSVVMWKFPRAFTVLIALHCLGKMFPLAHRIACVCAALLHARITAYVYLFAALSTLTASAIITLHGESDIAELLYSAQWVVQPLSLAYSVVFLKKFLATFQKRPKSTHSSTRPALDLFATYHVISAAQRVFPDPL
jgi:hypothetical protein